MDHDLRKMSREQLQEEVMTLRQAIRQHRDCSGHDLCHWHPELWSTLPEKELPKRKVPGFIEFLFNCVRYRWGLKDESTVIHSDKTPRSGTPEISGKSTSG